jgi:ABC-type phosphate/phosphonate transport system substrate-binding protein
VTKPQLVALALALLPATVEASPTSPLRIAAISPTAGPCAPVEAAAAPGEKAYYEHLAKRLKVQVLKCPVTDMAGAARALAAGQLDLAVLDSAAYATVKATTRSILTVRPEGALNRIPLVLSTLSASSAQGLDDLRGKTLVLGGSTPAADALPHRALADRGAGPGFFGRELREVDGDAAAERLRAGQADAMILHAAAWQRLCPKVAPKKAKPCTDLKVLMRIRPQASRALVVRRDMPDETRYRLIGIHMPMHLENELAFAWGSSWMQNAAEFEPAEAESLLAAH